MFRKKLTKVSEIAQAVTVIVPPFSGGKNRAVAVSAFKFSEASSLLMKSVRKSDRDIFLNQKSVER